MPPMIFSFSNIFRISFVIISMSCAIPSIHQETMQEAVSSGHGNTNDSLKILFMNHAAYISNAFDFPVGKPDAKGYYNAQPFGKNNHLGDDWNGVGGGNTDKGDPVYAAASGCVSKAFQYFGGWGRVVTLVHAYRSDDTLIFHESLYAHMDTMLVRKGDWVEKGMKIGTIGDADGVYKAHLHFEIRENPGMELGGGYSSNQTGYLDPTKFIRSHRRIE